MIDFSAYNPALGYAEAAGAAALDAVSGWWYGDSSELAQTTVPDYGQSPIDVPSSPPPSSAPRSPAPSTSTGNGAAPSTDNGNGSSISPVWVAAGVALVGLGGWYAYRSSR